MRQKEKKVEDVVYETAVPITKSPSSSRVKVVYDFATNISLREKYQNPWGFARHGRILEDMDALAGTIAWSHADDDNPKTRPVLIVTANVDKIVMKRPIKLTENVTLQGGVVWVGKSSMEIRMEVLVPSDGDNAVLETAAVADFTFVARDPVTNKATTVNQLQPETEEEKALFDHIALKQAERKKKVKSRDGHSPMSEPQLKKLDSIMRDSRLLTDMPTLAATDVVFMRQTMLMNAMMTQPQNRNMHGRIFGGFLMRKAFELAFSTAYLFAGSRPKFKAVDEIIFHRPVDIGNLLRFKSCVLYSDSTNNPTVYVEVLCHVTKPEHRMSELSNTFWFTFEIDKQSMLSSGIHTLRRVVPETEEEARRYLAHWSQHEEYK
jgi:acyl-coenzyme A thioesterase 9